MVLEIQESAHHVIAEMVFELLLNIRDGEILLPIHT